jgi:quercetin dioxygenase-like cupin family protein
MIAKQNSASHYVRTTTALGQWFKSTRCYQFFLLYTSRIYMDINKLIGKVSELQNLVNYEDGSVVSRTIIDKPAGTVTLFAFDKGQGLSEHTAPYDAMVYLFNGEAEITISGNSLKVKQGEMVIMPANQPHSLKAIQRFKMMLVMIKS